MHFTESPNIALKFGRHGTFEVESKSSNSPMQPGRLSLEGVVALGGSLLDNVTPTDTMQSKPHHEVFL